MKMFKKNPRFFSRILDARRRNRVRSFREELAFTQRGGDRDLAVALTQRKGTMRRGRRDSSWAVRFREGRISQERETLLIVLLEIPRDEHKNIFLEPEFFVGEPSVSTRAKVPRPNLCEYSQR